MNEGTTPGLPAELQDALASLHDAGGDQAAALAALCARHPEHADRLRDVFVRVQALTTPRPETPERIGPYRVLSRLGEGGMGVVWLCEQLEPVRQQVALKVMRAPDDQRVMQRFQQERQALALMNHDGIAKVFHCDATPDGRPYFVMEYVPGESLTQYCDRRQASIAERLALVQQVCAAVTHAHQKGVVHRDLKPGNILVADNDAGPRIKVIDFGLAKLTAPGLDTHGEMTEFGQVLGTLQYMAPEQADPTAADIDTRADVWALGVILYELLVGSTPWTREQLLIDGITGMRRLLRANEPMRASARLRAAGDQATSIARQRHTSASHLQRALATDLDWILHKALEPDRERRYDSAAALAADLQRYLDHEPVLAGPPSASYRLRKLLRRHRQPILAAAMVFVTAITLSIVAWREAVIANANLDAARERILLGEVAELRRLARDDLWWDHGRELDPAALATWLQRAARVQQEHDRLTAELQQLTARALPTTLGEEQQLRRDFHDHDRLDLLRQKASEIDANRGNMTPADAARVDGVLAVLRTDISRLEQTAERLRPRRFPEPADADRHRHLHRLLPQLEPLFAGSAADSLVSVRERHAVAVAQQQTAATRLALWQQAVAEANAAEQPLLRRLQSVPGLLPLGRDPDSGRLEFCATITGLAPSRDAAGHLRMTAESGLVFVLVPGGEFAMGAQRTVSEHDFDGNVDPEADAREGPVHLVSLLPFLIGKHEIHQAAWQRLTGENPSRHQPDRYGQSGAITALHPVESVSWIDANRWLRRLGMVLPTEARWEYAARAGTETVWWCGDHAGDLARCGNVADASARAGNMPWDHFEAWRDGFPLHAPIDSLAANPFGLLHVIGNVREWCFDTLQPYSQPVRPDDGSRQLSENTPLRVARGGHFADPARGTRSAARARFAPDDAVFVAGVRAVIEIPD